MNAALLITMALVMGVIFVNGWTDAPNAIATAISTRVISPDTAIRMAVILNFLGAFLSTLLQAGVAESITKMVSFEGSGSSPQVALASALFAIVVWAVAAWYFGIPTSESHALIAGLTGAALAMGGLEAINLVEWSKVLIGLIISVLLGFGGGFGLTKLIEKLFYFAPRRKAEQFFGWGQKIAAGANAFLHGAQDGQKFIGVFMLALFYNHLAKPSLDGTFSIVPDFIWVIALCSIIMGLGTSVGGLRIIKSVGMDMVKLETYQGFAADLSSAAVLALGTFLTIPLSTTQVKATAIMGVGASRRLSRVDWGIAKEMGMAWLTTFPGCGLIAYMMAKLFISIF